MRLDDAVRELSRWDRRGRYVFTHADLGRLFPDQGRKTLNASISRLVRAGVLGRAARGVFVNLLSQSPGTNTIEHIARALRRWEHNYVSLESALAEYGIIAQVPIDRITVMTTGRRGTYNTPWGVVEFTHTDRPIEVVLSGMRDTGRPLPRASAETAWRDLKRVGRNTHLVDREERMEQVGDGV